MVILPGHLDQPVKQAIDPLGRPPVERHGPARGRLAGSAAGHQPVGEEGIEMDQDPGVLTPGNGEIMLTHRRDEHQRPGAQREPAILGHQLARNLAEPDQFGRIVEVGEAVRGAVRRRGGDPLGPDQRGGIDLDRLADGPPGHGCRLAAGMRGRDRLLRGRPFCMDGKG